MANEREWVVRDKITMKVDKKRQQGEPADSEDEHDMEMDLLFLEFLVMALFQRMRQVKTLCVDLCRKL